MSVTRPTSEILFEPADPPKPLGVTGEAEAVRLPGTDHLGCGYNIFTQNVTRDFPDSQATGERLFDLGTYERDTTLGTAYLTPDRIVVKRNTEGASFNKVEGETIHTYQRDLGVKLGIDVETRAGVAMLKAAVNVRFDESVRRSSSTYFLSHYDRIHTGLLELPPKPDAYRELLTEEATRDLAEMPPADLFEYYGTHYLHGVIIGAEAVYNVATNTAGAAKDINVRVAAEQSFKWLTGQVKSEQEVQYREQTETLQRHSNTRLIVKGGREEYGKHILEGGNYDKWIESIQGELGFVAVPEGGLRPIWELCDGDRRAQLEAAFTERANEVDPEPDPTIAPVYAYMVDNSYSPRRWRYTLNPDLQGHGWQPMDEPFFYVSTEPGEGRVPVYQHSARGPIRFKLSTKRQESGPEGPWTVDPEPVWYAYPPDSEAAGRTDRVPIVGHRDPKSSGNSGWYYNVKGEDHGWKPQYLAFYADKVEFGN